MHVIIGNVWGIQQDWELLLGIIDLTQPITATMPVYPGDPTVAVESALNLDDDGAAVSRLVLGTHTGTHVDAPAHVLAGGRTVDRIELTLLDGPAHILHADTHRLDHLAARALSVADVAPLPRRLPNIVCLATGWDRYFHHRRREQHPWVALDLARELWRRGARVLGVDTLSPDAPADADIPVHHFWLGNDGVIVENLRGLTELPEQTHLSVVPLPFAGLDGSPVRALARV